MKNLIDINFDFKAEVGALDADKFSSTLQKYHQILWSKPLPNGKVFTLALKSQGRLYHKSDLGEFWLSSDSAIATFSRRKPEKLNYLISQITKVEIENFYKLACTIGGFLIWPCKRINNQMTINGMRGFNSKISDRFDLTVECIRRYYKDESSPLYETFKRYSDFFALFNDFKGYVDFFVLQDIVSEDYSTVKIAISFDDFNTPPIPSSVEEYLTYKDNMMKFIEARNARIASLYHS